MRIRIFARARLGGRAAAWIVAWAMSAVACGPGGDLSPSTPLEADAALINADAEDLLRDGDVPGSTLMRVINVNVDHRFHEVTVDYNFGDAGGGGFTLEAAAREIDWERDHAFADGEGERIEGLGELAHYDVKVGQLVVYLSEAFRVTIYATDRKGLGSPGSRELVMTIADVLLPRLRAARQGI